MNYFSIDNKFSNSQFMTNLCIPILINCKNSANTRCFHFIFSEQYKMTDKVT